MGQAGALVGRLPWCSEPSRRRRHGQATRLAALLALSAAAAIPDSVSGPMVFPACNSGRTAFRKSQGLGPPFL